MTLLLNQRWTRQPQYPVGIDWGNPVTRGLVLAWNAASGVDSITNLPTTGSSPLKPTSGGIGKTVTGSGADYIQFGKSAAEDLSGGPFSVFVMLNQVGNSAVGAWSGLIGARYTTTKTNNWSFFIDNAGRLRVDSGGGAMTLGSVPTTDGLVAYAAVLDGSNGSGYCNGVLTGGGSLALPAAGNTEPVRLGLIRLDAPTESMMGQYLCAAVFKRVLSIAEIQSLSQNPWQLFKPRVT